MHAAGFAPLAFEALERWLRGAVRDGEGVPGRRFASGRAGGWGSRWNAASAFGRRRLCFGGFRRGPLLWGADGAEMTAVKRVGDIPRMQCPGAPAEAILKTERASRDGPAAGGNLRACTKKG
jgi:hypothetical protein